MSDVTLDAWQYVLQVDDIPSLGARVIETEVGPIAVFKSASQEIFAVLDRCPHKGGPLSQGIVHGNSVTCPLHAWNIELSEGKAHLPDIGCVKTFQVQVTNSKISLLRSEIWPNRVN